MSELNRLLDNGSCVVIFKNQLNSYTAFAVDVGSDEWDIYIETCLNSISADKPLVMSEPLTDDFTPEKAIARLAEKIMRTGDYGNRE